jgi:hypothetical protein
MADDILNCGEKPSPAQSGWLMTCISQRATVVMSADSDIGAVVTVRRARRHGVSVQKDTLHVEAFRVSSFGCMRRALSERQ